MLQYCYDKMLEFSQGRRAEPTLAAVSFTESSFFPIPPDLMMIPMIIARPMRAWRIAFITTIASVLGGLFGYMIGAWFFETLGQPILVNLGKADAIASFNERFNDFGFWAVLVAGLTPFPFKVITIMSGWAGMPLATFVGTAIIARGARFFIVAVLLRAFGAPMRMFIERRLGLVFSLFVLILLGGFYLVRVL